MGFGTILLTGESKLRKERQRQRSFGNDWNMSPRQFKKMEKNARRHPKGWIVKRKPYWG